MQQTQQIKRADFCEVQQDRIQKSGPFFIALKRAGTKSGLAGGENMKIFDWDLRLKITVCNGKSESV